MTKNEVMLKALSGSIIKFQKEVEGFKSEYQEQITAQDALIISKVEEEIKTNMESLRSELKEAGDVKAAAKMVEQRFSDIIKTIKESKKIIEEVVNNKLDALFQKELRKIQSDLRDVLGYQRVMDEVDDLRDYIDENIDMVDSKIDELINNKEEPKKPKKLGVAVGFMVLIIINASFNFYMYNYQIQNNSKVIQDNKKMIKYIYDGYLNLSEKIG